MSFSDLNKHVIKANLCSRCGSCGGICPTGNIIFSEPRGACLPTENGMCLDKCNLCTRVCPGLGIDLTTRTKTNGLIFQKGIGSYRNLLLLHATDESIREHSTSGGAVTALLISFLDRGLIDGVISLGPDKSDPTLTSATITYDKYGILANTQSRYCVAPLNHVLPLLEKGKKYAFVGLPCMVDGLHKMFKANKSLRESIVITLGLFCHSTMTHRATRTLLRASGLTRTDRIAQIRYRQGLFPGGFQAKTLSKTTRSIDLPDFMVLFNYHSLNRCRLCVNHYNTFADIAFADPFPFLEELGENKKWTVTLARSPRGEEFLNEAMSKGDQVASLAVSPQHIDKMNKKHKTIQQIHLNQLAMNRKLGRPTPEYGLTLPQHSFVQAIFNLFRVHLFKDIMLSSREIRQRLIQLEFIDAQYKKLLRKL